VIIHLPPTERNSPSRAASPVGRFQKIVDFQLSQRC
jgi:hypothetical protein